MNIIIIGGGNVGKYVAKLLLEHGDHVRIIDNNEAIIKKLERDFPKGTAVIGNGSNPAVLEREGIANADVLLTLTGADETNLAIGTLAKYEYGVKKVIGRVNNPLNAWLYTKQFGIDSAINQAELLSKIALEEINFKDVTILLRLYEENFSIVQVEIQPNAKVSGKKVSELTLPEESILIAINRSHQIQLPNGSTIIKSGDHLIALVKSSAQEEFQKIFL